MLDTEPEKHWSFRVNWHEIDVPRILREATDSGITCLAVVTEFRTETATYVFIDGNSEDYNVIEHLPDTVHPVGMYPYFGEEELEDANRPGATPLGDNTSWYAVGFDDHKEAVGLIAEIVLARHWRSKKHRVAVAGF